MKALYQANKFYIEAVYKAQSTKELAHLKTQYTLFTDALTKDDTVSYDLYHFLTHKFYYIYYKYSMMYYSGIKVIYECERLSYYYYK